MYIYIYIYIYVALILYIKIFNVFKEVSYAHQGCIYLIRNTDKNWIFLKYYCNLHHSFLFEYTLKYNLWGKAEFSASILKSSVSHDPSEIILICWFIINVGKICAALKCLGPVKLFLGFFLGFRKKHLLILPSNFWTVYCITKCIFWINTVIQYTVQKFEGRISKCFPLIIKLIFFSARMC